MHEHNHFCRVQARRSPPGPPGPQSPGRGKESSPKLALPPSVDRAAEDLESRRSAQDRAARHAPRWAFVRSQPNRRVDARLGPTRLVPPTGIWRRRSGLRLAASSAVQSRGPCRIADRPSLRTSHGPPRTASSQVSGVSSTLSDMLVHPSDGRAFERGSECRSQERTSRLVWTTSHPTPAHRS